MVFYPATTEGGENMIKYISINVFIGILMTLSVVASAAPDGKPLPGVGPATASREGAIRGQSDKRIITPRMNFRERVDIQRAIKKRAAAKRNQLMLAADRERARQPKPERTGVPYVQ